MSRHRANSWLTRLAQGIDAWRVVPRIALGFYMWQMWRVAEWGMSLKDLSTPQTVFVSTVYGAFPLLLNFYMQQGVNWQGEPRELSQGRLDSAGHDS